MRSIVGTVLRTVNPSQAARSITTSSQLLCPRNKKRPTADSNTHATSDGDSSPHSACAQPKVYNSDITGSGSDPAGQLTDEQKKEVTEHNRYFSNKPSLGMKEKVDDKFWKGSSKA